MRCSSSRLWPRLTASLSIFNINCIARMYNSPAAAPVFMRLKERTDGADRVEINIYKYAYKEFYVHRLSSCSLKINKYRYGYFNHQSLEYVRYCIEVILSSFSPAAAPHYIPAQLLRPHSAGSRKPWTDPFDVSYHRMHDSYRALTASTVIIGVSGRTLRITHNSFVV